jgi:hypothetical protein
MLVSIIIPQTSQRDTKYQPLTLSYYPDEILADPVLRQAYDHFGHSVVARVRHNRYHAESLYRQLTKLHDQGNSLEALEMLHSVLENAMQDRRRKEWQLHADINVHLHSNNDTESAPEWFDVTETNVNFTAVVPMPTPTTAAPSPFTSGNTEQNKYEQKMQLAIGGQSSIEKGLGSTRGVLSASYRPAPQTNISSDLTIGTKHLETALSSTQQMADGTVVSAKVNRQYELGSGKDGRLGFGFSSNRTLSLFPARTVNASFAMGLGLNKHNNLQMQYSMISFSTWGWYANDDVLDDEENDEDEFDDKSRDGEAPPKKQTKTTVPKQQLPPPRLSAKFALGTQFPMEISVEQFQLLKSPERSGKATLSYCPFRQITKWKGVSSS